MGKPNQGESHSVAENTVARCQTYDLLVMSSASGCIRRSRLTRLRSNSQVV